MPISKRHHIRNTIFTCLACPQMEINKPTLFICAYNKGGTDQSFDVHPQDDIENTWDHLI